MSDTDNVKELKKVKEEPKAEDLPAIVDEVDRLRVQILDERLARLDLEAQALQRLARETSQQRAAAWQSVQEKYKLGPQDSFNGATGEIARK